MRNLVLFTSMILSFWGCSSDKDFGDLENIGWNEKPLQITTRILTTKSTNFIQEFKEGSMLGLQITSGTVDDLYNGIYNPQNEMFRLLGTKRSFSQNETFFFSHP